MIHTINGVEVLVQVGQFPTLVSQDKSINGKLMSNRTHCLPGRTRSMEKYKQTLEDKQKIKQLKKVCIFSNKKIV